MVVVVGVVVGVVVVAVVVIVVDFVVVVNSFLALPRASGVVLLLWRRRPPCVRARARACPATNSIPIIPAEDVKSIFATIPLVYDLNKKLFDLLCQRIARWSTRDEIGDIFSQFAPMLKMYIAFVSNYGQSVQRIAALKTE